MALKKIRVHELSKELGMTSKELLALASKLGIAASSPSASIEDAQADRIRRRADADGLRRVVTPEAPKATKGTKSPEETPEAPVVEAPAPAPVVATEVEGAPVAPAPAPSATKSVRARAVPPRPAPTRAPSPDGPTTIRPSARPTEGGADD